MKRAVLWIVGVGIVGVGLMLALRAQEQAQAPSQAQQPPATAQQEKVAFTFTDDAQMQTFAQFWQQRQVVLTRMAVLQAYWDQEQAGLADVNQKLLSQYNLDVNKNYTLDADRKVLIEREATQEQAAQLGQAPAPAQPASAPSSP